MVNIKDIQVETGMHSIPRTIHCNKAVLLDHRLANAMGPNRDPERDYEYDFKVFLPKYGIDLQRPYVWEHCQQNEFILSVLLEKPIDSVVVVMESNSAMDRSNTVMKVIDGKQRLMTIRKFMYGEFPIVVNGQNVYYKDLDSDTQRFFRFRVNDLLGRVYYSYRDSSDARVTDDMLITLFNYYNFAGTPQTEDHKNRLQHLLEQAREEEQNA